MLSTKTMSTKELNRRMETSMFHINNDFPWVLTNNTHSIEEHLQMLGHKYSCSDQIDLLIWLWHFFLKTFQSPHSPLQSESLSAPQNFAAWARNPRNHQMVTSQTKTPPSACSPMQLLRRKPFKWVAHLQEHTCTRDSWLRSRKSEFFVLHILKRIPAYAAFEPNL